MNSEIWQTALQLLARREHSTQELRRKLSAKGFAIPEIEAALTQLTQDKLLSEQRFIESFVQSRISKGYGPLQIQGQLYERGVERSLIEASLDSKAQHWYEHARRVHGKRFGEHLPSDYNERAKQARFLQQRGFTLDQINAVFKHREDE